MGLTPLMHPKSTGAKWEIQKQCSLEICDGQKARPYMLKGTTS